MHCGSNPIAQCPPEKSNGSRDNYSSNNCTSPNPIDGLFERPYFFTMLPHILNQAIKLRAKLAKLYHHKSNVRRRVKVLRRAARKLSRGSCFLFKIWHAAFGTITQNVAGSLAAIVAAQSTPERIDPVANAIVEATAPLIDDFEIARRAARAAIEAIAS
jgi:hypothetical protein